MTAHIAEAQAKVNLALAVTGRRDDGYHLLRSVFVRLALHDSLHVQLDPAASQDRLEIEGGLPPSGDDLVLRAAAQLRAAIDPTLPALRFSLRKRIPVAAGLGGGSSDAAAAIDLALGAWGVRLHPAERLSAALRLGADVPFFSLGHMAALVAGIGEHVVALPAPDPPAGIVLVTPPERLSTAAVFAEYDRLRTAGSAAADQVEELAARLRAGIDGPTLASITTGLHGANDLWASASRLSPGLAATREAVAHILRRPVLLTGSGPTLVAVYPSETAAHRGRARLAAAAAPGLAGATILATSTVRRGVDS